MNLIETRGVPLKIDSFWHHLQIKGDPKLGSVLYVFLFKVSV